MASKRREYFRKTRKKRMRDLKHSVTGWTGMVSALLAAVLFAVSVGFSFCRGGEAEVLVGSVGLIALVLAAGALVLGILAVREEKVRPVPPRVSLALGIIMTALLGGLYTYGL
ncbi:MAG: hypothetical protein LUE90_01875 [Clostridiales bacterium]|nr:hypothetical protein [Clostridiales bacterium]